MSLLVEIVCEMKFLNFRERGGMYYFLENQFALSRYFIAIYLIYLLSVHHLISTTSSLLSHKPGKGSTVMAI